VKQDHRASNWKNARIITIKQKGALSIFIIHCFSIQYGTTKNGTENDNSQYSQKYTYTHDVLYRFYNSMHIVVLQTFNFQVLKICRKKYKIHLRRNNYEVCTAGARCIPNILDVMVLENIKRL
jgi:hypothetical protein